MVEECSSIMARKRLAWGMTWECTYWKVTKRPSSLKHSTTALRVSLRRR